MTDLGRALLHAFGTHGVFPYVPTWAVDELTFTAPSTFSTFELDPLEAYLFGPVAELLDPACVRRFAVSYAGHGCNSYAWTVRLERPGLRLLAQYAFGGVYADAAEEMRSLRTLFAQVRRLDERVPETDEHDVVVLLSDFRSVRSVGLAQRGADPQKWEQTHEVDDVLEAVESLLAPVAMDPWDRLEQYVGHALRQSFLGAESYELLWNERFLLSADFEDGHTVVRLVPDESYEDFHADPGLRRFGWDVTAKVPNLHLVVSSDAEIGRVAAAVVGTAYFVWQLDPVATAAELIKVVGGDDNGGEWD